MTGRDFLAKAQSIEKSSTMLNGTLHGILQALFIEKGWNSSKFVRLTGFNREEYSRLLKDDKKHELQKILTVCIAMELDINETEKLLSLAGHTFTPGNSAHAAYQALFCCEKGISINRCNELLQAAGLKVSELLGPKQYNKKP